MSWFELTENEITNQLKQEQIQMLSHLSPEQGWISVLPADHKWPDHKTRSPLVTATSGDNYWFACKLKLRSNLVKNKKQKQSTARKAKTAEKSKSVKVKFSCHLGFTPGSKRSCAWISSPWDLFLEKCNLIDSTRRVYLDTSQAPPKCQSIIFKKRNRTLTQIWNE